MLSSASIELIKSQLPPSDCHFIIHKTRNSQTCGLYTVSEQRTHYSADTVRIFEQLSSLFDGEINACGFWIFSPDTDGVQHLAEYNPELDSHQLMDLILFQQHALLPADDLRMDELKEAQAQEKIKDSLAYACFINNTELILQRACGARKSALNGKLKYNGTALALCAQHDNQVGFIALVEAGADIEKPSLGRTPLEIALVYSPDIAWHIFNFQRPVFDRLIRKKGFSVATQCTDEHMLQAILECGADLLGSDPHFPNLHNFAVRNNAVGIAFLLKQGYDINHQNLHQQTALALARQHGDRIDAMNLLLAMGAKN